MLLNLTDLSDEPLHRQLFRQIRAQILAGHLAAGQKIPSIRELAREQRVSAITVQRAYEDLERTGVIHSRRGKGFFVAELPSRTRKRMAEERALEMLSVVVREILDEGLTPRQVKSLIKRILAGKGERS